MKLRRFYLVVIVLVFVVADTQLIAQRGGRGGGGRGGGGRGGFGGGMQRGGSGGMQRGGSGGMQRGGSGGMQRGGFSGGMHAAVLVVCSVAGLVGACRGQSWRVRKAVVSVAGCSAACSLGGAVALAAASAADCHLARVSVEVRRWGPTVAKRMVVFPGKRERVLARGAAM